MGAPSSDFRIPYRYKNIDPEAVLLRVLFLVRGKGAEAAVNSASHGAGRQMSRTQANKTITKAEMKAILKEHQVTLVGAGTDEAPMAYKDINMVMAAQTALVDVVAKFSPKMVRMADDGSRED